ncbi:MAG: type IV conjugative transfer system protein TraE [Syntrophales bacterium]|jgi:conjugal transfer pilus assembly protein TraE|nr:type IV conjugative transfer system protein TraE [Syntrophales bacterium]
MKLNLFLQKTSNIVAENRLLKFVVVVIGIATVVNASMTCRALNYQRTVIIPPVLNSRIEITGDRASEEYVKAFSRYIAALSFSYSPGSVKPQFDELLALYAPEAFPEGKRALYELADRVITTRVTSVFFMGKLYVDSGKNQIEMSGQKRQYVDDRKVEDIVKTYLIDYRISDGRFQIVRVSEKEETNSQAERVQ